MYKLNIDKSFIDKHTEKEYMVGDVVMFKKERAEELLKDERKLVSVNSIIDNDREAQDKKEDIAEDAKETLENEVQDEKEDTKKPKRNR